MAMPDNEKEISLQGQVAVVTGGGRGIGRAIALRLARAGATLAVIARSTEQLNETVGLIEKDGHQARAFPADVTDAQAIGNAMQSIEKSLGPVHVLVNNAGIIEPLGPFSENDLDRWWYGMEVNVRGPLLCTKAVLPGMIARKRGRIVNVSSGAGAMSAPNFSSYITSKTALNRFTECLALETKMHGLAVFSISPGTVRTTMSEYSLNSAEGKKWLPWFQRVFEEHIDVPAERPAQLVLELASGRLDALSGRFISIFDDLDSLAKNAEEIEKQNLYSLKLTKLQDIDTNPALSAVLAVARKPQS